MTILIQHRIQTREIRTTRTRQKRLDSAPLRTHRMLSSGSEDTNRDEYSSDDVDV